MRKLGITAAAVLALALVFAASSVGQQSKPRTFGNVCEKSVYKPRQIVLACGDGKVQMHVKHWTSWTSIRAHGVGVLSYPNCPASTPAYKCNTYTRDEATIVLDRGAWCRNIGRVQFTHLRITDPQADRSVRPFLRSSVACHNLHR
jgi:hypothetical protein